MNRKGALLTLKVYAGRQRCLQKQFAREASDTLTSEIDAYLATEVQKCRYRKVSY